MTDTPSGSGEWADHHANLAVIFVHGIGSQGRGATLLQWVEPMVELLQELRAGSGLAFQIASARGLAGDDPEIVLELGLEGEERVKWLLTEARWAEAFHPSSASEVLGWAFGFAYRAISRVFDLLVRQLWFSLRWRYWQRARDEYGLEWKTPGRLLFLVSSLFLGVGLIVYMLLVPVLLVVLLLALAVALSPIVILTVPLLLVAQRIPGLGKRVRPLLSGLVTSIGDAQAYRSRAIQAAAMRDVLIDRLAEARQRASRVVVIAHSQGAALSVRTFLEEVGHDVSWPDVLITVGAGTTLLNDATSVDRWAKLDRAEWVNIWTQLDPVPAGPIGHSRSAVRARLAETVWHQTSGGGFEIRSTDGRTQLRWVPARVGPGEWTGDPALVASIAKHSRPALTSFQARDAVRELMRSSGNGWTQHALPAARPSGLPCGPEEWPVTNRLSVLTDHTTYAQNYTEVQYGLVRLLIGESGGIELPPLPASILGWHVRRVRALLAARLMALTGSVAIIGILSNMNLLQILTDNLERLGRSWTQSRWTFRVIPENLVSFVLVSLLTTATALTIGWIVATFWRSWHRRESLRTCADPTGPGCKLNLAGVGFVVLHLFLTMLSAIWWLDLVDFQSSVEYPMSHTWAETALHHGLGFGLLALFLGAIAWPFIGLRPRSIPARRSVYDNPNHRDPESHSADTHG